MNLWPHQERGLAEFWRLREEGYRRILLTAPPRAGKTVMMGEIIQGALDKSLRVAVYTHRVMLTDQMSGVFGGMDLDHGIRASGFAPNLDQDVQICSIMTDNVRVYKRNTWDLHDADIVIVDEADEVRGDTAVKILGDYHAKGATVVGFTATPVDLAHLYDVLYQVALNSELRACGAHIPARTFGPDEPDMKGLKRQASSGEYKPEQVMERMHPLTLFGRVIKHWRLLNPLQLPTILFAPSVDTSKWFVDEFNRDGIKAAHIDGENCYMDGVEYSSDQKAREDILAASKAGEIKVLCNRFVLRRAIDMPWMYHGIAATVFGSIPTFIQAGSRILNSYPGYDHVIWQCHGGSWHRWGSLNEDRHWALTDTKKKVENRRKAAQEEGRITEIRCPKCGGIRSKGPKCPHCGHEHKMSSRTVVQVDGVLKEMKGAAVKKKKEETDFDRQRKAWNQAFFSAVGAASGNKTMLQVLSHYRHILGRAGAMPYIGQNDRPISSTVPDKDSSRWNMRVKEYYEWSKSRRKDATGQPG